MKRPSTSQQEPSFWSFVLSSSLILNSYFCSYDELIPRMKEIDRIYLPIQDYCE